MKKLIALMTVAFAAVAAQAEYSSYFYWDVNTGIDFDYAMIRTTDGAYFDFTVDVPDVGPVAVNTFEQESILHGASEGAIVGFNSAFDYLGSQYLVELYNYGKGGEGGTDGDILAKSSVVSGAGIESNVYSDMATAGDGTPFTFSGFITIPEPTSGLLLLLGVAGLALRRKRA